jgi:hypothetical protein
MFAFLEYSEKTNTSLDRDEIDGDPWSDDDDSIDIHGSSVVPGKQKAGNPGPQNTAGSFDERGILYIDIEIGLKA